LATSSLSTQASYRHGRPQERSACALARWLVVDRGARHLLLTSRHGLPEPGHVVEEQPIKVRARITAIEVLEARSARVTNRGRH
jgi:hypothetical protein